MIEVLVADDDHINRALVHSILKKEGCQVIEARSGEEAVEKALFALPDLIVMDIMMPGMGGVEALHRIRQNKVTCHIPVIALTAMAMRNDREKLLIDGFDVYISKPLNIHVLIDQVRHLLHKEKL